MAAFKTWSFLQVNERVIISVGFSWSLLKSPCSRRQSGSSGSGNGRVGKAGFSLQSQLLEESSRGRRSKKSCWSHRTSLRCPAHTLNGRRRRLDRRWPGHLQLLRHCPPISLHGGERGQSPRLWKTGGSSAANNRHNMKVPLWDYWQSHMDVCPCCFWLYTCSRAQSSVASLSP